jgi:GntP family gluconate:H+ symporter
MKKKLNSIIKNSFNEFLPILLLTSMGAGYGNIIKNSDLTLLLPDLLSINNNSILYICFIGFICSAILKTSQGSSTSSMIIVSSIIFPIISDFGFDIFELSMVILSIGSGSMMISHVNDSYFWIVTKQTKFNLLDGLKYFSIMSIAQSFGTFLFIVLLINLKSL